MKLMKRVAAFAAVAGTTAVMGTTVFALDKQVGGGNGSITVKEVVENETYKIYKIFDATVSADGSSVAYTTNNTDLGAGTNWFEVNADTKVVTPKTSFSEADLKTAEFKAWVEAYAAASMSEAVAVANDDSITFKNVPYGYYYVTSTTKDENGQGGIISVTSASPNGTTVEKNIGGVWDNVPPGGGDPQGKVIKESKGQTTNNVKAAAASLGDDIDFDIGLFANNYSKQDKIYRYCISDVIAGGMTYKADTLNVTVKDATGTHTVALGGTTGYTIKYYIDTAKTEETNDPTKARAFFMTIPWTTDNELTGDHLYSGSKPELHVKYTAFLDPAKADKINYDATNENVADFDYWKNGDPTTLKEPDHYNVTSKTDTYSTKIKINKQDGKNNYLPLQGAEFTITGDSAKVVYTIGTRFVEDAAGTYWKLKDNSYTTTNPTTPGIDQSLYADTTTKYRKEDYSETQGAGQTKTNLSSFVNADGTVEFAGLGEGEYTISETVVPAGYNKAEDVKFTLEFDKDTKTWTVTKPVTATQGNTLEVSIVNNAGTELPGTGGIGTKVFYIAGPSIAAGAGILLFVRKRMKSKQES